MDTTANRIKYAMEKLNIKQADIVERTGISKGALSSYVSGKYVPKQKNIYLIAKALGVSESWLMGADVPMYPQSTNNIIVVDPQESNNINSLIQRLGSYLDLSEDGKKRVEAYAQKILELEQLDNDIDKNN